MSITLMTAVWKLDLPPSDKMVLLALADAANDEGVTWMAVRSREGVRLDLLTKCSLSERAIQGALKRLCEGGYLARVDRPGRGVIWTVTPAASAPPQHLRPAASAVAPAASAGKPSLNRQPPSEAKASSDTPPSRGARFVPDGWSTKPAHVLKAQTLGLDLHEQEAAFRDYEYAKPVRCFDRAFHRWLRNARKFADERPSRPDKLTAKLDNLERGFRAAERAADFVANNRTF